MMNEQRKKSVEERQLTQQKELEEFQNAIKDRHEKDLKRAHSMKEIRENEQQMVCVTFGACLLWTKAAALKPGNTGIL